MLCFLGYSGVTQELMILSASASPFSCPGPQAIHRKWPETVVSEKVVLFHFSEPKETVQRSGWKPRNLGSSPEWEVGKITFQLLALTLIPALPSGDYTQPRVH